MDDTSSNTMDKVTPELQEIALNWLNEFSSHLATKNADSIASLFLRNGWLRDSLVFSWETRALEGPEKIAEYLSAALHATQIDSLVLDDQSGLPPSRFGLHESPEASGIEFAFVFETPLLKGRGFARLVQDHAGLWKAFSVYIEADQIKGYEELGHELGLYGGHTISWGEVKSERRAAVEGNPQVLIIGAGQSGLQVAARFRQMSIRSIVVEQNARVGDNWRERYPTLTLHTPRSHHHLLYAPFPHNWPIFTPRDKVAAWLEQYAESQDLVVWTSSTILPGPTYDSSLRRWTVIVNRNGSEVVLYPNHIVLATGALGDPFIPAKPSSDPFEGTKLHASAYQGGLAFSTQRVLVIGAGNTSADICQDLVTRGAKEVTMLQRSETVVISAALKAKEYAEIFPEDVPVDINDFKVAAMPLGLLKKLLSKSSKQTNKFDREMHEGLQKNGLKLSDGPDGGGNKILVFERLGGYWIDVGLADMIIDGRVKIKSGVEIERFKTNGVVFTDGSELEVDAVIYATGYSNIRPTMKKLFGDAIIDQTKEVWGLNKEGEIKGCYCPSGHPGLWFAVGDFFCSRYMSKQLALYIKSEELGLTALRSLASVPTNELTGGLGGGEHRSRL